MPNNLGAKAVPLGRLVTAMQSITGGDLVVFAYDGAVIDSVAFDPDWHRVELEDATGIALAAKIRKTEQVAITYLGEGSSNQGDFHEGLNFAGIHQLPVVYVVENNGYAISVPMALQSAVEDIAVRAAGRGFLRERTDRRVSRGAVSALGELATARDEAIPDGPEDGHDLATRHRQAHTPEHQDDVVVDDLEVLHR